jgi:hypothetical protein
MEHDSPRDRREGPAGSAEPRVPHRTASARLRFRRFLSDRVGGVAEAAWYFDRVLPRLGDDPDARVAAEELLDHLARLMRLDAARPDEGRLSVWSTPLGSRMAVALVDTFEAVSGIGRAARDAEELRAARESAGDGPVGLLCVMAGDLRRRPIEQLLEVRRSLQPVRIVGLASILSLARAVEAGAIEHETAAAALEPTVFADPLVSLLARPRPGD